MGASSDGLKASIDSFLVAREGDATSSASLLPNNERSTNRYLFAVVKLLPFASHPNVMSCRGRFERRAGNINRLVFSCKNGRCFPIAFCATKKQTIHKQVNFLVCKVPSFAYQLHEAMCHLRFQRWAGSINRPVSIFKRATLCCRPLHHGQMKESQAGNSFSCVHCTTSHPSCQKSSAIWAYRDAL